MAKAKDKLAILRGTLDVLVLRSVSARPLHGFEISLWLDEQSEGALEIDDSALYQALHRLEAKKLLQGAWGISENNRRARYYRLTPAGRRQLTEQTNRWDEIVRAVNRILRPA